ncbi:MAG TPA: hypothetical protein VEP90_23745, partial [Methylomirabilota bacterium]|nr:hypothetical protein [Methylomirabilota bacterium]
MTAKVWSSRPYAKHFPQDRKVFNLVGVRGSLVSENRYQVTNPIRAWCAENLNLDDWQTWIGKSYNIPRFGWDLVNASSLAILFLRRVFEVHETLTQRPKLHSRGWKKSTEDGYIQIIDIQGYPVYWLGS